MAVVLVSGREDEPFPPELPQVGLAQSTQMVGDRLWATVPRVTDLSVLVLLGHLIREQCSNEIIREI